MTHTNTDIKFLYVDLFCGAGGTTTGVESAEVDGKKCAITVYCVNHDPNAIASHEANHPHTRHATEDIRTFDLTGLVIYMAEMRKLYPAAKVVLWASLECTNHSKAKGGMSRDADSRTLAEHLYRYIEAINPDYIQIENVEEFMIWGPLMVKVVKDKVTGLEYCPLHRIKVKGKKGGYTFGATWIPDPDSKSEYFNRWVEKIKSYGYRYDYRIMNAADYGAYTSRKRYFGIFAQKDLPIVFPKPTHAKNADRQLFGDLKQWMPVREVLDLNDEGTSIFGRKIPIVDASLLRIHAGLVRFVAGGKDRWMMKYNSVNGETKRHVPPSIDEPCPTVSCQGRLGVVKTTFISRYNGCRPEDTVMSVEKPCGVITTSNRFSTVQCQFLSKYYSGNPYSKNVSVNGPAGAITTKDSHAFVNTQFLQTYYGHGAGVRSINEPAATVTTKDRLAYVKPQFIANSYSGGGQLSGLNNPNPSLLTNPKQNLVTPWILDTNFNNIGRSLNEPSKTITADLHWHYLVNPQYTSAGGDINKPCFTLIARMDKMPPSVATVTTAADKDIPNFIKITAEGVIYEIFDTDSEALKAIKEFMALYGIVDIKMRMLKIPELKKIQGFPESYVLIGTQGDQKKFIGNSVHVLVAKAWTEALSTKLIEFETKKQRKVA